MTKGIRPRTSTTRHSKRFINNHAFSSDGFRILKRRNNSKNPSFLDIKTKELQKPILLDDYENIYAGEFTNI